MAGEFRPFRGSHAIVEVVFFFEFSGRINIENGVEKRLKETLVSREWRYEPVQSIEVNVTGSSSPDVSRKNDGFQLTSLNAAGEVAWQIRANRNQLSLHCLEYSRWAVTSTFVREYLTTVLSALGDQRAPLRFFGMKVLDRFMYFGGISEYCADNLFNRESKYLNASMFESGNRWHLHTGWFDAGLSDNEEMLSQLSIDSSAIAPEDHRPNLMVSIDHTISVRPKVESDLGSEYSIWDSTLDAVFEKFERIHGDNKKVICDVLSKGVSNSLNMQVG